MPKKQHKNIRAFHFVGDTLRDGSPIPKDGEWLHYKEKLVMCKSGLHWSKNPFDALQYAPGGTLCYVEVKGKILTQSDKGCSSHRKIIARMDATDMLRYFARQQALSVIHLYPNDTDSVVFDYLMTGDESIRAAARAAAWAAARNAAWDAAWDAARAAARNAAWDAAWDAARDAARAAAWAAARNAAWAAAWAAARNEFTQLVYECFEDYL